MKRLCSLVLAVFLLAFPMTAQAIQPAGQAMDVILVSDASGSMAYTDPEQLRVDAARLLLEILPAGSRVGSLVFSGAVRGATPMVPKSDASIQNVTSLIANESPAGYTNIGAALEHALGMAVDCENAAILLLTDGATEMDSPAALAASLEARDRALATAAAQDIPIYGVALNANGKGNVDEIVAMTQACVEVSSAADLEFAYSTLASFLQGGVLTPENVTLPYSGTFRIPAAGVTEVNLIIIGSPDDMEITVTRPDGTDLTARQLNAARTVTRHCTLLKLTQPLQAGLWRYSIASSSAVTASTHLVYNSNFQVELTVDPAAPSPGQPATVTAAITHGGAAVCDDDFTVTVQAVHADTGATESLTLVPCGDCYTTVWTPTTKGAYYLTATADLLDGAASRTCQLAVSVTDWAPIAYKDTQTAVRWSGPFAKDTQVDLSGWFDDPEGKPLRYCQAIPGAGLAGSTLTLTADTPAGAYLITAADPAGGHVSVELQVKARSTWVLLAPAALVAAALILFLLLRWRASGLVGCVTLEITGDGKDRKGMAYLSGHRMPLSAALRQADLDCPGLDPKVCFHTTKNGPALDEGSGRSIVLRPGESVVLFTPEAVQLTVTLDDGSFRPASESFHTDGPDWAFTPDDTRSGDSYTPNWD